MPSKLKFYSSIVKEIADPATDDLLILAKGLGIRRVICTLLKIYDGEKNLILLVSPLSLPQEPSVSAPNGCRARIGRSTLLRTRKPVWGRSWGRWVFVGRV
jgi:hypothetical protein